MNDLLITTITGLVLWQNGKMHMMAHGNYYGLSWDSVYVYLSFNPQHRNVSEIEVFNRDLLRIDKLTTKELRGVHQIFVWDGELHVINTSVESVFVYNSDNICHFNWSGHKKDENHINSIWINDDYIYVVEGMTAGQKGGPGIQVLSHQYKPIRRIPLPAALQIHNVYIENGVLYGLGKFGLVKKPDKKSDYTITDLRPDKENGFLRGLARSKDFFYIGESQILPRNERVYGDSRILILNNECEIVDHITLKDTGQIQDIRIINDLDFAHNRIPFNYKYPTKNVIPLKRNAK